MENKNIISKNEIKINEYTFSFKINLNYFDKCFFSVKKDNSYLIKDLLISDMEMLNSFRKLYIIRNDNLNINEILKILDNIIISYNII